MELQERKGSSHADQRQALRNRILDAARRIVVRDGFAALSMRKIAEAIGYSPASLYLYFENRDEIARALGHEGHAQLFAQLEPCVRIADPAERLRALAHAYVAFGRAYPQTYRVVFIDVPGMANARERGEPGGPTPDPASLFAEALDAVHGAASAALAEAFWATLHGIVALSLTQPEFPHAPPGQLVDAALDAWLLVRPELSAEAPGHATRKTNAAAT